MMANSKCPTCGRFPDGHDCCHSCICTPDCVAYKLERSEEVRRLRVEAQHMLNAVTFATPMNMGGTEAEPNMCYPARVPVAFVTGFRAALAETAQEESCVARTAGGKKV